MTFAARLNRSPTAFDPEIGREVAEQFADQPPEIRELIAGTAGCSPYLAGLLRREADWLVAAFDDPEAARDEVLSDIGRLAGADLKPGLRVAKRRIALLAGVADLGGVWSLEDVTGTLTRLADAATDAALRAMVAVELKRGKLPDGAGEDGTAGLVAVAMGKMGAFELNYSSDIDLICLFDDSRYAPDDVMDARSALIRATRNLASVLSDITADGYVFRTDLRLRPDASVTPVCISVDAAERYYESFGRTWERAAYIKARASAGDIASGERFLRSLRPFVWRKHLDFAAIEDAHQMRLRIRDEKGLHGAAVEGLNVKLGRGGIREIEFFTQTRQLISGGRDQALRPRGTVDGLAALARAGWIPDDVARGLTDHYRALRELEHRLQMIHDAQTQTLPKETAGFDRLAAFMGKDARALRAEIKERMEAVHALTEGFFAPDTAAPAPDFGTEVSDRWLSYPALRSPRAVAIFRRLKPKLLARLQEAAKPEEALAQFDGFLRGLPAGVQLLSLFDANPQLTSLIVDICATAPALAAYLSRNSSVFDAVIGGDFFAPWPGVDALQKSLEAALEEVGDYEARLDATRRWMKEWHFRVGVHLLRGHVDAEAAGHHYADLAEAVVAGLWPVVEAEFAGRHGRPPGRGAVVLGMGSLGAGWLNATSDLDLIVIYDAAGVDMSDGPRPLPARTYYARLTQALVTALSAPMAEGRLYEVDMRLRPSGKQGPVATSFAAFKSYQTNEAWTWEHLALTRARAVAGPRELRCDVETFRREVLIEKSSGAGILGAVAEMRGRLAEAKGGDGPFDAKAGPGRLSDIELLASAAALQTAGLQRDPVRQLTEAAAAGWLSDGAVAELLAAIGLFRMVQAIGRLLSGEVLQPDTVGEGGRRLILQTTGAADIAALELKMANRAETAAALIAARLKDDGDA